MFLDARLYFLFLTSVLFLLITPIEGPPFKVTPPKIEEEAKKLLDEGEYEKALPIYNDIIEECSFEPQFYSARGLCNWNLRKLDAAIADFEQALELDPQNTKNRYFLALSQFHSDNFTEALANCHRALNDGPSLQERMKILELEGQCTSKIEQNADKPEEMEILRTQKSEEDEGEKLNAEQSTTQGQRAEGEEKEGDVSISRSAIEETYMTGKEFFDKEMYLEALKHYEDAINLDPTVLKYYEGRGQCNSKLGRTDLALKDYKKMHKLEPYNARYKILLAETLMDVDGDYLEALDMIEEVLGRNYLSADDRDHATSFKEKILKKMGVEEGVPVSYAIPISYEDYLHPLDQFAENVKTQETAEDLFQKSTLAYDEDRYHEAIDYITQAIAKKWQEPKYYLYRGIMYWAIQELDQAIMNYLQSLELDPKNVKCRLHLAQALYDFGEYEGALEHLRIIENSTRITSTQRAEARALFKQTLNKLNRQETVERHNWPERKPGAIVIKDEDEVRERSERNERRTIHIDETVERPDVDLNRQACRLFEREKYEEALEFVNAAVRINDHEPSYYRNRAMIFEELDKNEFAVTNYEQAVALDPLNIKGRLLLVQALINFGKFSEVLTRLEEVLNISHITSAEKVKVEAMRKKAHRELDRKAANRWPQEGEQITLEEENKNAESDPERRERNLGADDETEKMEAQPSSDSIDELNGRGNAFFNRHEYREALSSYSTVIERNPREAMYRRNRAACYMELGNLNSAKEDLELSLMMDPHNPRALYLLAQTLYDSNKNYVMAMEYLEEALMRDHLLDDKQKDLITSLLEKVVLKADEEAATQRSRKGKGIADD